MKNENKILTFGVILCICAYIFSLWSGAHIAELIRTEYPIFFPLSITFWVFIVGTYILYYIVKNKDTFFDIKISEMNNGVVKFYYSKFLEVLGMFFSVYIIAISILWALDKSSKFLQIQSLLFLVFFIYIIVSLYNTILKEFKERFKNYEN